MRSCRSWAQAIAPLRPSPQKIMNSLRPCMAVTAQNDREVIDRLWNPYVAAWYEGGKDDPKLVLLRLDAERAQIWENATSLFAGIKLLFGGDPKEEYKEKVAKVKLA